MNREQLLPHLKDGWRLPSSRNFVFAKIHTYWFPGQQQGDDDNPTYNPPILDLFPKTFSVFKHPKIVRLLTEAAPDMDPNDGDFSFTLIVMPPSESNEGPLNEYLAHPELAITLSGTSTQGGTKVNGVKVNPGHLTIDEILTQAQPNQFVPGTLVLEPIPKEQDGSTASNWASGLKDTILEKHPYKYSQLMTNKGWIAGLAPCEEDREPHSFYGPNVLNIRVFTNTDAVGYYTPEDVVQHAHAQRLVIPFNTFYYYHTSVILDAVADTEEHHDDFLQFNDELDQICHSMNKYNFEYKGTVDSSKIDVTAYLSQLINDYFQAQSDASTG